MTEAAFLSPEEADDLGRPWDELSARAAEPNAFLSRWAAQARLRHLPDRTGARVLAAWRGESRRLVGLMVLVRPRGRHFNPLPVLRAAELYAPLSTPLLDAERPAEIWAAMLAALAREGIGALALPFLGAGGPVAAALREAAAGGFPLAVLGGHRRALLPGGCTGADYMRSTLERRRRREADRQRRRLSDQGSLDFAVARSPAEVAAALDGFLALEAAGWKGRAGTALAAAPGAAAYFREAAEAGARAGAFRVATLLLDGRPVAAGLVSIAGRRAFYVKTAYDEDLARYSPGLLLTLDLTAHLLDDPAIEDADSVADADHPMIDRLWTGRCAIESLLVGTRPEGGAAFRAALAVEKARLSGRDAAKAALAALKGLGGDRFTPPARPPRRSP